jgi:ABC-type nitrate/sulfonate/bicarbonate transport system substrate-binding protein
VRDKVLYGELDAAQAPAGMLLAMNCGLGCVQCDVLTALVLNLHGNGITLSRRFCAPGTSVAQAIERRQRNDERPPLFGVVSPFSSHAVLMRDWFRSQGLRVGTDVEVAIVPPSQVFANLRAGHLEGYCVGEPWNSMAVISRLGWVLATSDELAPGHPEKVLLVSRQFAEAESQSHLAMVAALIEACEFCDAPENRERLCELLAHPDHVDAPIQALRMGLGGLFDHGDGRIEKRPDLLVFHRRNANEPSQDKARWVADGLVRCGAISDPTVLAGDTLNRCFRSDLFHAALQLTSNPKSTL